MVVGARSGCELPVLPVLLCCRFALCCRSGSWLRRGMVSTSRLTSSSSSAAAPRDLRAAAQAGAERVAELAAAAPRDLRAAAQAGAERVAELRRAAGADGARGAAARTAHALLVDALRGCAAAFPELAEELAEAKGLEGQPRATGTEAAVVPLSVLKAELAAAGRASELVLDDSLWPGAGLGAAAGAGGSADAAFQQWFLGRATSALGDQLDAVRKEETFSGSERDMDSLLTSLKVGMGAPTFDALCCAIVAGGTAARP
jgi:hypothetical protein